jgi:hypothetical protein
MPHKRNSNKTKKRLNKKGGNRRRTKVKRGGSPFPPEYHGSQSGRYFPENDPKLALADGAHGKSIAVSYGNNLGPDMGPSPDATQTQTGGRVSLPPSYFGSASGQGVESVSNAYGDHVAVSMGHTRGNTAGPNLAVSPDATGIQTGGKKKRSKRKSKRSSRK